MKPFLVSKKAMNLRWLELHGYLTSPGLVDYP